MIDEEEVYDYLEHFGVTGMRWGVRTSASTGKNQKTCHSVETINSSSTSC